MTVLRCILSLSLLSGGAAAAQDRDWSGPMAGASLGIARGEQTVPETALSFETAFPGPAFAEVAGATAEDTAAAASAFAGYRWQSGAWVGGVTFEVEGTRLEAEYDGTSAAGRDIPGGTFEVDAALRAMGELGYASGPNLFTLAAGPAAVRGTARTTGVEGTGYSVRLGWDRAVSQNMLVGVALTHTGLDGFDELDVADIVGDRVGSQDVDMDYQTLAVRLTYEF
ncbi:outer membrane protein [Hasllibacter halocynthiae]|nr:hypothetical protein [Hasllibacter halocynthiae]